MSSAGWRPLLADAPPHSRVPSHCHNLQLHGADVSIIVGTAPSLRCSRVNVRFITVTHCVTENRRAARRHFSPVLFLMTNQNKLLVMSQRPNVIRLPQVPDQNSLLLVPC